MTSLLLLLATLLVVGNFRLRRATSARVRQTQRLAGPPLDPESGMFGEDALQIVVGADLALVRTGGHRMTMAVCAVFARDPAVAMRAVEQVRRAHEPCIRIGRHRFAIVWHHDTANFDEAGARARLARTIVQHCQVADLAIVEIQNIDAPARELIKRARAAARPVQDHLPAEQSPRRSDEDITA